jgi:hypothetical protein
MIDRGLSPAQISALNTDEIASIVFVDIDWPGGRVRAHTGIGERIFMGQSYLGVGEVGGIGDLDENNSSSPNQLPLTLKVLDAALVALVMNESPEGRDVSVHLGILDENRVIAHEIPYVFDGIVAKFGIKRGDVDKQIPYIIRLGCSDWLERWSQPANSANTTNEAQQHLFPGDRIFDLTEIIAGSPLSSLPTKTNNNNNNFDDRFPGRGGRYTP